MPSQEPRLRDLTAEKAKAAAFYEELQRNLQVLDTGDLALFTRYNTATWDAIARAGPAVEDEVLALVRQKLFPEVS